MYKERLFLNMVNAAIKSYSDSDLKIIFVQHNNNQLINGTSDWEINHRIDKHENDIVIQKYYGNAFQKTNLKQILLYFKINSITICGLVSHGCVKATCLGGLAGGFETTLLKNGHTNWNTDFQNKITTAESELNNNGIMIQEIECQPNKIQIDKKTLK